MVTIKVEKQGIAELMSKVQDRIKRPVTIEEMAYATGVTSVTLRKMRNGEYGNPEKLKPVYEFLYKLGGLKPPKRVAVAWLVWEDDEPIAPTPSAEDSDAPSQ